MMNKFVLKYGAIAGLLMGVLLVVPYFLLGGYESDMYAIGEIIGYSSMILSLLAVYFGIKSYRNNEQGGYITYGRAVGVGTLISIFAGLIYAVFTIIFVEWLAPDFTEKYYSHQVEQVQNNPELSAAQKMEKINEMNAEREMFSSGFFNGLVMFFTVFPIGLIISLISAAVLKKKPLTAT